MEGQKASGALTGPSVCSSTSFHDYDTRRKHRPFFRSYIRRVQSLQFPGELGPLSASLPKPEILLLHMPLPDCMLEGVGVLSSQRINMTTLGLPAKQIIHARTYSIPQLQLVP